MSSEIVSGFERTRIRVIKRDGRVFDVNRIEVKDGFNLAKTSVRHCLSPSQKKPYVAEETNEEQSASSPGSDVPVPCVAA